MRRKTNLMQIPERTAKVTMWVIPHVKSAFCVCVFGIFLSLFLSVDSAAQTRDKRLSVGGMVGKSAGPSIKYLVKPRNPERQQSTSTTAVSIDLSITDDDYYLVTAHGMINRSIPSSPLNLYLGPGAAFGARDAELVWGLSSVVGVFFEKARFEVFMQLTPRIILLPEVVGEFGSAVGLRYYL